MQGTFLVAFKPSTAEDAQQTPPNLESAAAPTSGQPGSTSTIPRHFGDDDFELFARGFGFGLQGFRIFGL